LKAAAQNVLFTYLLTVRRELADITKRGNRKSKNAPKLSACLSHVPFVHQHSCCAERRTDFSGIYSPAR